MPTIKWRKVGGSEIQSNSKYVIKDYGKRLTIKNLIKSDTGKYQCTFTRAKSTTFPEAELKVVGKLYTSLYTLLYDKDTRVLRIVGLTANEQTSFTLASSIFLF